MHVTVLVTLALVQSNVFIRALPVGYQNFQVSEADESTLSIDDFIAGSQKSDSNLVGIKNETKLRQWKARMTSGDIIAYPASWKRRSDDLSRKPNGASRSAFRDASYRWPNGEIPYTLSKAYGPKSRSLIARAMDAFQKNTCIRFVPRNSRKHVDYLQIIPDDGCYSMIGRVGGAQPLSLDDGCLEFGIIVHELMHAAGFIHEHSRSDRDQHVKVLWNNILSGFEEEFDKYDDYTTDNLGFPYDYNSIMHYDNMAFTRNGLPTMVAVQTGRGSAMGQRDKFSALDLQKISKFYYRVCGSGTSLVEKTFGGNDFGENELHSVEWSLERVLNCQDANGHCSKWAKSNLCTSAKYKEFLAAICPLSCGLC